MQIHFLMPPEQMMESVKAYDRQGNEVEVAEIVISPLFFQADSRPDVLFGRVMAGEDAVQIELSKFAISVSGSNGKLRVADRSQTVRAAADAAVEAPVAKISPAPEKAAPVKAAPEKAVAEKPAGLEKPRSPEDTRPFDLPQRPPRS